MKNIPTNYLEILKISTSGLKTKARSGVFVFFGIFRLFLRIFWRLGGGGSLLMILFFFNDAVNSPIYRPLSLILAVPLKPFVHAPPRLSRSRHDACPGRATSHTCDRTRAMIQEDLGSGWNWLDTIQQGIGGC
jgi:hypothetical protein